MEVRVVVDEDVFMVERQAESLESFAGTALAPVDPQAVLAEAVAAVERALGCAR